MKIQHGTGTVETFDPVSGVASVHIENPCDTTVNLHTGAFFSGRHARFPNSGDTVLVKLQELDTKELVAVAAWLTHKEVSTK